MGKTMVGHSRRKHTMQRGNEPALLRMELGGNVHKGEHGTKVYFVKQLQVRDQGADDKSSTRFIPMTALALFTNERIVSVDLAGESQPTLRDVSQSLRLRLSLR
jgi:hypothetical protein